MLRWARAACSADSREKFTKTRQCSRLAPPTISTRFSPMFDLAGKVAIVTGASRGIGRGVALMLAARGARVVAAARGDHAGATAADIQGAGGTAEAASLDVTDAAAVDALVAGAIQRHGRVDILVN